MRERLNRLHRAIERKTGIVFGRLYVSGYTTNGFPLRHLWLVVAPRRDGYAFAVTVKGRGVYVDKAPSEVRA